jgi:opacity protein-like surface antigen
VFNQPLDARGFAVNGDIGYNFKLQDNWFAEPSAGFIWSRTEVDPLNVSGTYVLGTGISPPGTVAISDIYSAIGRLSLRVGTTLDEGNVVLQPFGTASFLREFEGSGSATLTGNYAKLGLPIEQVTGSLNTTGIGNYGQFGVGVAGQIKDTGWLGYIRADYRIGDDIQGWSLNAGVRYQFSPDMVAQPHITKGPAPEPVAASAPYNWTGFRVGAMLGADWGYTNWTFIPPNGSGSLSPRFAGILPGGLIGYDYQIGNWVIGAAGDMGWTNAHGSSACPNNYFFSCENQADWLATATGRIGYTFWNDRVLTYAKAGLAIGRFSTGYSCNTGSQPQTILVADGCPGNTTADTNVGWTVGAGTEFGLTKDWSAFAETNYFNLGTHTEELIAIDNSFAPEPFTITRQGYTAKIGLVYHFDVAPLAPVIAKY